MEDGNYKVCKNFAFPNIGIMNEFDNTFADLIEEAKEVL
jgi:hypothetical protein